MPTHLRFRDVRYCIEDGVHLFGFVDAPDASSNYLLLQRMQCPAVADVALGHGGIHIELNDQGNSTYGGIEEVDRSGLGSGYLRLLLTVDAARALGCEAELIISFEPTEPALSTIVSALSALFP